VLKQVYHAAGIADAVDFKLSPGVRGPEHTGRPGYSCVDEENCDEEKYFLCAQHFGGGVDYFACSDAGIGTPASIAQSCAKASSLKWEFINSCFEGAQGNDLLKQAALYFDRKFPKPVGVPHKEIDGSATQAKSYTDIISALCATGIKAGVCAKIFMV